MQTIIQKYLANINWSITPEQLYEPIGYTLESGGKRIRPQLVLMGCALFDSDFKKALDAAIAVEIFHNFTLLHDDVMDHAEMRRNRPTVHTKWDENTAILSGDAMLIKAYRFLEKIEPEKLLKVLPIFSEMALQVCEGQQYDMNFENSEEIGEDEYFKMIRLKTAVLLAASLQIGAIIGNASTEDAHWLYEFGIAIGIAFQLRDDYLDVYGDPKIFGKKIGGDILCKKKSFLLVNALKTAKLWQKAELKEIINSDALPDDEKIAKVTAIYNTMEIPQLCEKFINNYMDKALTYLDKVNARFPKQPLIDLAIQLSGRKE
ncbi:MAG: polyprenyl synthetase family protein [Sphingobacteriia bacterium]|jgi:geranylgeranyl diphosphate synthase, type II|nr:polyprenyl synthetase family protein [Paludibacteraceae bacterium]NCA78999.1 polyprenyl synthetase family protein [Sphingobacteriia bacterium]